jgi:hypothetical protein
MLIMKQAAAREKVQQLVEKFDREQAAGVINQYNESETKTGFIEPLLQALGWDTQDRNEASKRSIIYAEMGKPRPISP